MTISSLFRFTFKKAGAIVALAAIVACSPSYNWRELDVADGHVRAAFPDTVKTETRDTRVDTMTMPVTMASARSATACSPWSRRRCRRRSPARARAGAGRGGDAVAVPEPAGAAAAGVSALWPGHRDTGPERRPTFWMLARVCDRHHADRGHRGRQREGCASARANSWIRSCSRRRRERIQQFFLQGLGHGGAPSAHAQPFAGVAQVEVDRAFAQAEDAGGFQLVCRWPPSAGIGPAEATAAGRRPRAWRGAGRGGREYRPARRRVGRRNREGLRHGVWRRRALAGG